MRDQDRCYMAQAGQTRDRRGTDVGRMRNRRAEQKERDTLPSFMFANRSFSW